MRRLIVALLLAVCINSAAADAAVVEAARARIRWLPGDLPLAGYVTLHNAGTRSVRLVGASSAQFGAVMLHRSVHSNGMDRMEAVTSLVIEPGHEVRFAPGSYHIMLMHRRQALQVGDRVPITLHFAGGQSQQIVFVVHGAQTQ